jgi:(R,R)-butanediol dehydrogenase/meso-butanediol dehydrogenase/diacetyl reductase
MRAAIFKGVGTSLSIEIIDDPRCGPTDLVLRVCNCGICGSDLHMTEATSMMPLPSGSVMGHEFAGEVVEVGSAMKTRWKTGDRVAGFPFICCGDQTPCQVNGLSGGCTKGSTIGLGQSHGAYAEYVRIGGSGAYKLPDGMPYDQGALVEPLAVGLHAVAKSGMKFGDTVLVIGAGPVGLATMLWAKFLGAKHVIISEKAETRQKMAARFGATDAIDPARGLAEQVEKIAGRGPNVIFECVGVPGMIQEAMMQAPAGSRILVAGVCQAPDTIMH